MVFIRLLPLTLRRSYCAISKTETKILFNFAANRNFLFQILHTIIAQRISYVCFQWS